MALSYVGSRNLDAATQLVMEHGTVCVGPTSWLAVSFRLLSTTPDPCTTPCGAHCDLPLLSRSSQHPQNLRHVDSATAGSLHIPECHGMQGFLALRHAACTECHDMHSADGTCCCKLFQTPALLLNLPVIQHQKPSFRSLFNNDDDHDVEHVHLACSYLEHLLNHERGKLA